jgi:hypothetical protein
MILIRVDLREAAEDAAAYDQLKRLLNEAGFSQTIKGEDGTRFKLPRGDFRFTGDEGVTLEAVRSLARAAVDATRSDAGLLVMQVSDWRASRLKIKMT